MKITLKNLKALIRETGRSLSRNPGLSKHCENCGRPGATSSPDYDAVLCSVCHNTTEDELERQKHDERQADEDLWDTTAPSKRSKFFSHTFRR
jgi:hypothetical protein